METIREGRVIIHLETGKVELKAPQLDQVIKAREQELKLAQQLREEEEKLAAVRAAQASSAGGGSGGGGRGGGGMPKPEPALWEQYNEKIKEAHHAQLKALESAAKLGEGLFRIARASVELGATSEESLEKMIKGLARVQGYFDLFKGSIQVVVNLGKVMNALADAQKAVNAAQAIGKALNYDAALTAAATAARAFFSALGPIGAVIVIVSAAVAALTLAYDALTTSEAEAKAEAKELFEKQKEAVDKQIAALDKLSERYIQLRDLQRGALGDEEKIASLRSQASGSSTLGQFALEDARQQKNKGGEHELLELARRRYAESIKAEQDALNIAEQRRDKEVHIREEKIRQIEAAQRLVDNAQKELDLQKEKARQFQAQIGSLNAIEQQQIKDIRDKLKAGVDISEVEEKFLSENAGEPGRGIVEARRAKRAEAAGFGADFFEGIEGAGTGLKDAAKALDDVVAALKKLTDGTSAAEAKAKLEQEKKGLEDQYRAFYKTVANDIKSTLGTLEAISSRLTKLEEAARNGT